MITESSSWVEAAASLQTESTPRAALLSKLSCDPIVAMMSLALTAKSS